MEIILQKYFAENSFSRSNCFAAKKEEEKRPTCLSHLENPIARLTSRPKYESVVCNMNVLCSFNLIRIIMPFMYETSNFE